jgi:hypothetical protein
VSAENGVGRGIESPDVLCFRAGEKSTPPTITKVEKSELGPNAALIHYTQPDDNGGAKIQKYVVRADSKVLHTAQATSAQAPILVEGLTDDQM